MGFDQSDRKKALNYVNSFPTELTSNPTDTIQKWEARLLPQFASLWYSFQGMIQKTSTDELILTKMDQFYEMVDRSLNSTDKVYWFCNTAEVATLVDFADVAIHNDFGAK